MSRRTLLAVLFSVALAAPAVAVSLPDPTQVLEADGHEVTITRDAYGVPHIYAEDAYALFWGNGYAQAQDRLFQMDVLRHVGKGESARFLGPAQLQMDLATRRELYTDAERTETLNALPADLRRMFEGYTAGVNAFIAETRTDPMKLSAEFYAIGHPPEDWVPEDTIALAQFLLDIFGAGSGGGELDNARVYKQLVNELGVEEGRKAFTDFFWMYDDSTFTTLKASDYVYDSTEGPLAWEEIPEWQWELLDAAASAVPFGDGSMESLRETAQAAGMPAKFGSNALVVGPGLSQNGGALLIGGPQMAYYNPMIPYEVALHQTGCGEDEPCFDALGMGVGGAPGVIIGRTEDLAWTVTSGSSDQVDVVGVKLAGPRSYFESGTSGAVLDMDCRIETHVGPPTAIDQNPPQLAVQEVCRTIYGPVFAINHEDGYAFSRMRTHRLDEVRSGALWLTISLAQNMDDFAAHMETFKFEFNFHVADSAGNIGYYHFGANPDRSEDCDPRFPRLAGLCDWEGVRTGSQLPHKKFDASTEGSNYIVNWNNKPAPGWSSGDSMEKWGPQNRAELIDQAVQAQLAEGLLTMEDLHEINEYISTRSPYPAPLVDAILDATAGDTDPEVQAARAALEAWAADDFSWEAVDGSATCDTARDVDPCFGVHSPGFTLYEAWRSNVQDVVFFDELETLRRTMGFVPETSSDPHAADHGREDNKENVLYNALTGASAHAWCDNVHSDDVETCADVFADVFRATVAELGSDATMPMHTIKFVGLSGGPSWRIPMVNRPSFNHYYDFAGNDFGSNLPPGTDQTWNPVPFIQFNADGTLQDAHKNDQLELYVDFEYKPADMTPVATESTETFIVDEDGPLA